MVCTITDLLGMRASQAKVTVVGYVDERFFFVSIGSLPPTYPTL